MYSHKAKNGNRSLSPKLWLWLLVFQRRLFPPLLFGNDVDPVGGEGFGCKVGWMKPLESWLVSKFSLGKV